MSNYLLLIEYDGTNYSGWQKQPECQTIQNELEKAVKKFANSTVKITAAGRTDKGVHAICQAASMKLSINLSIQKLQAAFNSILPKDISVIYIKKVNNDFNARYSAKRKIYEYRIWNKPYRSPLISKYSWHIVSPINIDSIKTAAKLIIGKHNFSAFDASGGKQENKIVNLKKVKIIHKNGYIFIVLEADRFLYKMVRNLVGTFVQIGINRIRPDSIKFILDGKKRIMAGPTAPAHGLFLKEIIY